MKTIKFKKILAFLLLTFGLHSISLAQTAEYTTVVEGFDWGPMVNKVIVGLNAPAKTIDMADFQ